MGQDPRVSGVRKKEPEAWVQAVCGSSLPLRKLLYPGSCLLHQQGHTSPLSCYTGWLPGLEVAEGP